MAEKDEGSVECVLAKALVQAGELKEPGETVWLRSDQIERLEPEGYFEHAVSARTGRGKAQTKKQEGTPQ